MGHHDGARSHVCLAFECDAHRRDVMTSFIRDGLVGGERVMCILDDLAEEDVHEALAATGLSPGVYARRGQLRLTRVADTYLAGGVFQPERMLDVVRTEAGRARAEGQTGLRITGEMSWALGGHTGSSRLLDYERAVGVVLGETGATGLCQYDRRRFDGDLVRRVAAEHEAVLEHGQTARFGSKLSSIVGTGSTLRVNGEVDMSNWDGLAHAISEAASAGSEVTLDLSGLEFIDAGGLHIIHRAALGLRRGGGRMVLRSPRPMIARTMSLLGWDGLDCLSIEPAGPDGAAG